MKSMKLSLMFLASGHNIFGSHQTLVWTTQTCLETFCHSWAI